MRTRTEHVLAVIVTVAGCWLAAGCSVHVSVGHPSTAPTHPPSTAPTHPVETPTVPRHTVETEVANALAKQQNQPVPKVVCQGDLKAEVGTVMYCSLTAQGTGTAYPVQVQVASTSGNEVHLHMEVSTTPGHFTAPG